MAAWTFAGSTFNTTAGNKTVTATPVDNDLIVIVAACTLAGGTISCSDNDGGTYTLVDSDRTGFSTAGVLNVFVRDALITSASSTIFTAVQPGSTGGGLHVYRLSGMALVGAAAVRSNGGQSSGGAGTTPAPVLSQDPHPMNPVLIAVAAGANAAVMVPRTNYTEGADGGYNTPATGLGSAVLNEGEITATLTFGGTTSTTFASVGIEFESQARSYHGLGYASTAVMAAARDAWRRRRSGIVVPKLWLPEGAVI